MENEERALHGGEDVGDGLAILAGVIGHQHDSRIVEADDAERGGAHLVADIANEVEEPPAFRRARRVDDNGTLVASRGAVGL